MAELDRRRTRQRRHVVAGDRRVGEQPEQRPDPLAGRRAIAVEAQVVADHLVHARGRGVAVVDDAEDLRLRVGDERLRSKSGDTVAIAASVAGSKQTCEPRVACCRGCRRRLPSPAAFAIVAGDDCRSEGKRLALCVRGNVFVRGIADRGANLARGARRGVPGGPRSLQLHHEEPACPVRRGRPRRRRRDARRHRLRAGRRRPLGRVCDGRGPHRDRHRGVGARGRQRAGRCDGQHGDVPSRRVRGDRARGRVGRRDHEHRRAALHALEGGGDGRAASDPAAGPPARADLVGLPQPAGRATAPGSRSPTGRGGGRLRGPCLRHDGALARAERTHRPGPARCGRGPCRRVR